MAVTRTDGDTLTGPDAWLVPDGSDDGEGTGGDYFAAYGRLHPDCAYCEVVARDPGGHARRRVCHHAASRT